MPVDCHPRPMVASTFSKRSFLGLWFFLLFLKLGIGFFSPIAPDEGYYWLWAQKPWQWGYFDHPPGVVWVWKLGEIFPEYPKAVGLILGHLFWLLWAWAFNFSDPGFLHLGFWHPLWGLSLWLITPDLWLMIGVAGVVLYRQKIWDPGKWQPLRAFGMGFVTGLTFLAKYHGVLLLGVAILWWLQERTWRRHKYGWLTGLLLLTGFFLAASPNVVWNWQNNWVSYKFQLSHGFESSGFNGLSFLEYGFFLALICWPLNPRPFWQWKLWKDPFWNSTWIIVIFFGLSALRKRIEYNWVLPFIPFFWHVWWGQASKKAKLMAQGIWALISSLILSYWLGLWPPVSGLEKLEEGRFLNSVLPYLRQWDCSVIYTDSYQKAGWLGYHLRRWVFKVPHWSWRPDQLDQWYEPWQKQKRFCVVVSSHRSPELIPELQAQVVMEKQVVTPDHWWVSLWSQR